MFPAVNHHPELRPPIADVVIADDFVAEERGDTGESVPEHRAANVPDMHRLGDVRRAEVDDDAFRGLRFFDAEAFVAEELGGFCGDRFGAQSEINEAGAGDGGWLA
jgi:hypothetical protein